MVPCKYVCEADSKMAENLTESISESNLPNTEQWDVNMLKKWSEDHKIKKFIQEQEEISEMDVVKNIGKDTISEMWDEQISLIKAERKRKKELHRLVEERKQKLNTQFAKSSDNLTPAEKRQLARQRERENRKQAKQTIDLDKQNLVMSGLK